MRLALLVTVVAFVAAALAGVAESRVAVPALTCEEKDDRLGAALLPLYERYTAVSKRQLRLVRTNAPLEVRTKVQFQAWTLLERLGDAARRNVACTRGIHRLRLLFIQIGTKATQMRSIAQAIAQANSRGDKASAREFLAALLDEQRDMERLSARVNAQVANLVNQPG